MRKGILNTIFRSLIYYRAPLFFQFLITAFLAAIIAGSLLTGSSVRQTLKANTEKKLNNAGIVISSGLRYFNPELSEKLQQRINTSCVSILELKGFSSNFSTGESAINVQIFGVGVDFFSFNLNNSTKDIKPGEALINNKLAERLNINLGDEIIIRFENISNIPLNAPFAPEEDPTESIILTVGGIADDDSYDKFTLRISQLKPLNIFLNLSDLEDAFEGDIKVNRLLIESNTATSIESVENALREFLSLDDVGLQIRKIEDLNQYEIISERIFIDKDVIAEITNASPKATPLITYLANSIAVNGKATPYSFVSAIPVKLSSESPQGKNITINNWLAQDLNAKPGDTLVLNYYVSDSKNTISEESSKFIVDKIVNMENLWGDAMLMPEFPGISGTESCSNWDAGVAINFDNIRDKDEDYWNDFKGTPKAFINYTEGVKIWGNNFGPATALRFSDTSKEEVIADLSGMLNPGKLGFSITDSYADGIQAANSGVDFSTLFLSLSFFIIASAILLLSLLVSSFFESRKKQVKTLFSLGFKNNSIANMLLFETALISFIASLLGVFLGVLFNDIIIYALNSVWEGAVQTNTLSAYTDFGMLSIAFISTFLISLIVLFVKIKSFLRSLNDDKAKESNSRNVKYIQWLFPFSILLAILPFLATFIFPDKTTMLFFLGGSLVFINLLLFFRWIIRFSSPDSDESLISLKKYSWFYYAFYPSKALSPIIFIAAGLFIIIITGANRKSFDLDYLSNKSGTGGYMFWAETMSPIKENLNFPADRIKTGLDQDAFADLSFLQALKLEGDDASCLNLNQVAVPSVLGIDSDILAETESFSFAAVLEDLALANPWDALKIPAKENVIYGIADQTVLMWGLKMAIGDTLSIIAESGEALHIVFAGGLKPSVFQGSILIGRENFSRFMPSIAGSTLFLARGNPDKKEAYKVDLNNLFNSYGLHIEYTEDRLSSFYEVTNTYLTVFMTLGGLGMVLGIFGLGLIMMRNIDSRKSEYAFLIANGFTTKKLRFMVYKEYSMILFAGIITGTLPAIIATLPSLLTGVEIPWTLLVSIILIISLTGIIIIKISADRLIKNELIGLIRKD
ncbi:MAG: ABC transporter permease [Bacteroidales bacterium]|jgi:putative ABC transport system permease protein|nr:ABC transporter permease [Bacteroidales bacterium]